MRPTTHLERALRQWLNPSEAAAVVNDAPATAVENPDLVRRNSVRSVKSERTQTVSATAVPTMAPTVAPTRGWLSRWFDRIEARASAREFALRDAYLAEATDRVDLEWRMKRYDQLSSERRQFGGSPLFF